MPLIIDIGNSRVKYFWQKNVFLSAAALMEEFISLDMTGDLAVTLISSVPDKNNLVLAELEGLVAEISPELSLNIEVFDPGDSQIQNLYPEIGADRVAKLQSAINLQPGQSVAVFDFGTATTMTSARYEDGVSVLDQGFIALGLYASLESISEKCSELPNLLEQFKTLIEGLEEDITADELLAKLDYKSETEKAIFAGTLKAHQALIREWQKTLIGDFYVYGLGDLAKIFAAEFDEIISDAELMNALT